MSSNQKQFALIGLAAGLFASIMLTGVVGNAAHGNYLAIPLILLALVFAVGAIWLGIWLNSRRIQLMYRRPTPDKLIDHYHAACVQAKARRIPNSDAAAAHLSALAATIYGQYDRARQELAAVDWDETPALFRGHRLDILALIALFEKRDVAKARQLEQGNPSDTTPILRGAIQVAIGDADAATIKRIERAATRGTGAIPAVCAWALSLYADRSGQPEAVGRYTDVAREAAPHFAALPPAKPVRALA